VSVPIFIVEQNLVLPPITVD